VTRRLILIGASIAAVAAISVALMRRPDPISTGGQPAQSQPSLLARVTKQPQGVTIPSGTKLHIRLEAGVSTKSNHTGDRFTASLDGPLSVEGKQVALNHSKIVGELIEVKQAGRIKGRAQITLVLTKLVAGNKSYDLHTQPLTFTAPRAWKRDALLLAGSSALGAVIGAIAGGGKGAAIGAGIGGGAGTGWWLATPGAPVAYGPETRLTFTLARPLLGSAQSKPKSL